MGRRHTRAVVSAFLGLLALAGCVASHPVRTLEDGLLQVDCPGGYHDWSVCHASARKHCGKRGFRIVAQVSDEGGAVGTRDWSREGSEVSRTMEFRCAD